jgi:ribonuclease BN (tRNA processing enzyme)
MSHVHWDHIMGFPFFAPAYVPGYASASMAVTTCSSRRSGCSSRRPASRWNFRGSPPISNSCNLKAGASYDVAGFKVTPRLQRHTGDSYGYRFERDGKIVVYSTDSEHKLEDPGETRGFADFFRNADLVIFDAMYSLLDAVSVKEDWGHSSNIVGVEMAQMANVKHLCMFHHEPAFDDERIESVLKETIRFEKLTRTAQPLTVTAAYDGMEIEL